MRWLAPESLENGIYTCNSDMWAYGVLLYEVITVGNHPFKVSKINFHIPINIVLMKL